jgi:glutamyl-tRNA synthetase
MFKGEMILMFEDINPSGDKKDLEKCILEDIKMLGVEYSKISYTSDYFG